MPNGWHGTIPWGWKTLTLRWHGSIRVAPAAARKAVYQISWSPAGHGSPKNEQVRKMLSLRGVDETKMCILGSRRVG